MELSSTNLSVPVLPTKQVQAASSYLWKDGSLEPEGDMIPAPAAPAPLVLTLPTRNTLLEEAVKHPGSRDPVITRLKGVNVVLWHDSLGGEVLI